MRNIKEQENIFEIMSREESFRFSMFHAIRRADKSFLITDGENIIMGQERETSPLWIYIKGEISQNERDEIVEIICRKLRENPRLYVDGEEEYMDSILNQVSKITGMPHEINLSKNSYICRKQIKPNNISGSLSKGSKNDLEILTSFCKDNWEDIGFGVITLEQARKMAIRKVSKSELYVWRDHNDKIVAMASVHKHGEVAMTDGVFTNRKERGRGYAKFLMYEITKNLLEEYIPILYADSTKAAPNHVYRSIGYKYCGGITEYRFREKKV